MTRTNARSVTASLTLACLALGTATALGCDDDAVADATADAGPRPIDDGGPPPIDDGGRIGTNDGGWPGGHYAVLVRGSLFTTDLAEAQARHDVIAGGGREAAIAAGDFGHDVGLGTSLLGSTPNAFLAIDRWRDLTALQAFYADPMITSAFGTLFSGAPDIEVFVRHPWLGWGDLDSADGTATRHFAVVRGRFASADPVESRRVHDAAAGAGQAAAMMAGDVAHVVFLRVDDPREFLAIDVWAQPDAIEAVYGNPDFQAALAPLFEAPPTIGIYAQTGWAQW